MSMKIRKGDKVKILSGKDRDSEGTVLRVLSDVEKVVVEKVALVKKSARPTQANPRGGILTKEAPIHVSRVQLVCPECGKPTRVSRERDGKDVVRVCKKCDARF